ncbi:amidase family protein [Nocardia sp. NPDC004860]|uniref:amidase family protein n=1 Tax=Nocardia sp. NPDC004860 TaxID=3154557 RepID=UPI0033A9BADB
MSEIWKLTAAEMARAISRKEVSSREAVSSSLERIAQTAPVSNAFEDLTRGALEAADRADELLAAGTVLGPLHGVPVALKSNHDLSGYPTSSGVPELAQIPGAADTAPVAQRLTEAGAIVVGRTRMPPGGFRWSTESAAFGPTRNPWDHTATSGASSGGAGVAVAVGAVPIAIGNDIGGSIRYPAAVNGVLGLRPTVNRVPTWLLAQPGLGMPNAAREYCVDGPLARSVEDLRIALEVIGAPDPRDPFAVDYRLPYDRSAKPRIGVVRPKHGLFVAENTAEVESALDQAAAALSDQGHRVEEVHLPQLEEAAALWWQLAINELVSVGYSQYMEQFAGAEGLTFWKHLIELVDDAFGKQDLTEFSTALQRRSMLRREMSEFMADTPILLTAASGEPPYVRGEDARSVERTAEIIGHQWVSVATPLLGLPGVGMGTAARHGKAPLGVQITGRAFAEDQVLDVTATLTEALPLPTPIEPTTP